ncbi:hypothetical protein [Candidatus Roseilinea sp. NK_OTU-006]|jgi:hypothetical protein|nr:hypothetical protein [Candidatus Roseilinea sp. NK_OTU-006]
MIVFLSEQSELVTKSPPNKRFHLTPLRGAGDAQAVGRLEAPTTEENK